MQTGNTEEHGRHSVQNPIMANIDTEGYKFYDTKSLSQNGCVGLYVKTSLISTP